jgi:glycosyltransferase involved in cell wall biosynthesis
MKVAIVIPAYNEEKRIVRTLEEYGRYFRDLKNRKILDFEIIVVINNTTDKTEDVVKLYAKKYKEIVHLNFKKGGKGFAITEGFKYALKKDFDLIGFVDADMSTGPKSFYDLIRNIGEYDGTIASRWIRGSRIMTEQSLIRKITSMGFNFLTRTILFLPYKDTQCGAKIFRKETLEEIIGGISVTQWAFDVNLLYLCKRYGKVIMEVPTVWEDNKGSKLNLTTVPIQMFLGIIRLRLINSKFEPLLKNVKFILGIGDWLLNKK